MSDANTLFFLKAGAAPIAPPILYKAKIRIIFLMAMVYLS